MEGRNGERVVGEIASAQYKQMRQRWRMTSRLDGPHAHLASMQAIWEALKVLLPERLTSHHLSAG